MKIWTPKPEKKPPCHPNGYLQRSFDAAAHRNRFCRNPWAKVGSLFVPQPLRMSPGYPCCCEACEGTCYAFTCSNSLAGSQAEVIINGVSNDECTLCTSYNDTFILPRVPPSEAQPAIALDTGRCCNDALCQVQYADNFFVSESGCIADLRITFSFTHNCLQESSSSAINAYARNSIGEVITQIRFTADSVPEFADCSDISGFSYPRTLCINSANSEDCSGSCCDCSSATGSANLIFP